MILILDPQSSTPIYRQLADQIRTAIEVGELASGERLPTAGTLAAGHGIAPSIVLKAYERLAAARVILDTGGPAPVVATPGLRSTKA